MKRLLLVLLIAACCHAQEWRRDEYHDAVNNESGVKFLITSNTHQGDVGGLAVVCSKGKFQAAWLLVADKVIDVQGDLVEVKYRRDDEPNPHTLKLEVNKSYHGAVLYFLNFQSLLYGPRGFGGGEGYRNWKANNWARKLVVGVPVFLSSDTVLSFNVPDPTPVLAECKAH